MPLQGLNIMLRPFGFIEEHHVGPIPSENVSENTTSLDNSKRSKSLKSAALLSSLHRWICFSSRKKRCCCLGLVIRSSGWEMKHFCLRLSLVESMRRCPPSGKPHARPVVWSFIITTSTTSSKSFKKLSKALFVGLPINPTNEQLPSSVFSNILCRLDCQSNSQSTVNTSTIVFEKFVCINNYQVVQPKWTYVNNYKSRIKTQSSYVIHLT